MTVTDVNGGFAVEDDRPGIPPEERERLFESDRSSTADGAGLRLEIVEHVAEVHGWDLTATEGRDGGARVEVTGVEFD